MPARSIFVCLSALSYSGQSKYLGPHPYSLKVAMPEIPTLWLRVWTLGHVVVVSLETEINYVVNWSTRLHNGALIKTLNIEAWVSLLTCQYSIHIVTYWYLESNMSWLHGEKSMDILCLEPSWTLPYVLPLTGVNLYPFPIINHAMNIIAEDIYNWGYFGEPPKLAVGFRSEGSLGVCALLIHILP